MADFTKLSDLLTQVNWDTVTDVDSFEELPEGYYLCEVEKAELKMNKAQTNQQVSFQLKVIEPGIQEVLDAKGYSTLHEIPGTQNRKIFKHYPFKDVTGIKRFVTDMLKFEGDEPGVPILEKEYFMHEETIEDALDILVGLRIYVQVSIRESQGTKSTWNDIISWARAKELGLPM